MIFPTAILSSRRGGILVLFLSAGVVISCSRRDHQASRSDLSDARIDIVTFVSHDVLDAVVEGTVKGLTETWGVMEENIRLFNPEGDLDAITSYIGTLNRRNTDLLITVSTPASQAALAVRPPGVPLMYSFVSDPSALEPPQGETALSNFTGISNIIDYAAGFGLLRDILPSIGSIGVLYHPSEANSVYSYNRILDQAARLIPPLTVTARPFTEVGEIRTIAQSMSGIDLFYVGGDNVLNANIDLLLTVARGQKLPVFASDEGSVRAGAIAAYSIDYQAFGARAAQLAARILRQGSVEGIEPVLYSEGRCVINMTSLASLGIAYEAGPDCITYR